MADTPLGDDGQKSIMSNSPPARPLQVVGTMPSSFRAGEVISQSFEIFFGNLISFTFVGALGYMPILALAAILPEGTYYWYEDPPAPSFAYIWIILFASVLSSWLAHAALVEGVLARERGEKISGVTMVLRVLPQLPQVGLTALVVTVLTVIGLLLLVVPGVIASVALAVAVPVVVAERRSMSEAINRSLDLTAGHRWGIFGAIVLGTVIWGIAGIVADWFLPAITAESTQLQDAIAICGDLLVTSLSYGFWGAFYGVLFLQLREAKEGKAEDEIAEVFS